MEFKLKIEMDNEEFQGDPALELRVILRKLADGLYGETFDKDRGYALRDTNGNTVGVATIKVSS